MRSCLLLCAALCVGQLVCALPSAQYVAPIYNPDELPPMIKLPVRKTVIGAPCAVTDERQKFGTVPNPDAEDKRLAGKCVQQKNCPPERLHFGYPSFCSKETGAVCCLDRPLTCMNVDDHAWICQNSDTSDCKNGQFLDLNPNICPLGSGGETQQCCKSDRLRDTSYMPLSDGASGVIANEFLQNTDPLGTSYELQETKNNPKPYFPQQGSDPLERITALGVSQQSSVPLQNTDAQLPNNEPAFSIPDSKFVVNRGDVLLNFFEDLTF